MPVLSKFCPSIYSVLFGFFAIITLSKLSKFIVKFITIVLFALSLTFNVYLPFSFIFLPFLYSIISCPSFFNSIKSIFSSIIIGVTGSQYIIPSSIPNTIGTILSIFDIVMLLLATFPALSFTYAV